MDCITPNVIVLAAKLFWVLNAQVLHTLLQPEEEEASRCFDYDVLSDDIDSGISLATKWLKT